MALSSTGEQAGSGLASISEAAAEPDERRRIDNAEACWIGAVIGSARESSRSRALWR
jgi:hypothetical protein